MRRSLASSLIAVLGVAAALAGAAIADFHQSSRVTFTTHRSGHSTGFTAQLSSSDATAPGAKPKRATKLVIGFPAGTRFNLDTPLARACTLTDRQLTEAFGPSCLRGSQIGTGSAVLNAMPIPPAAIPAQVKAYVSGPNSILVLLYPDQMLLPGTPPIIVHSTVAGTRLALALPHVVYGRGRGRYKSFHGIIAVIVSLKLNVSAIGSGADALLRAGSCQAGEFVLSASFTYADRSRSLLSTRSRCS